LRRRAGGTGSAEPFPGVPGVLLPNPMTVAIFTLSGHQVCQCHCCHWHWH
jgi:hypothetical protein